MTILETDDQERPCATRRPKTCIVLRTSRCLLYPAHQQASEGDGFPQATGPQRPGPAHGPEELLRKTTQRLLATCIKKGSETLKIIPAVKSTVLDEE